MSLDVAIRKRLGDFSLEVDFSLTNNALAILGPSGCGKSMTLRCIAGVETPDSGRIVLNGRVLYDSDQNISLPPQQRRVGMLFQQYALFPTMTVAGNIGVGIPAGNGDRAAQVRDWIRRMQLDGLERHLPRHLSGGQQQRVALARMLAAEPELILLDEPFSALDYHLREHMQLEMRRVMEDYPESIMVTHNRDEAYRLCDELMVLEDGRMLGRGECKAMFQAPGSKRIAQLTGCKNLSRITRIGPRRLNALDWGVELTTAADIADGIRHVGIRAHDLTPSDEGENCVPVVECGRTEDPFEWNILFTTAPNDDGRLTPLWWKFSKYSHTGVPQRLRLPAEALLLLTD